MENQGRERKVKGRSPRRIQHNCGKPDSTKLRDGTAVGVVVAVNKRIPCWAKTFFAKTGAAGKILAEAGALLCVRGGGDTAKGGEASMAQAEAFLGNLEGRRETIESRTRDLSYVVNGDGFKAFRADFAAEDGFEGGLAEDQQKVRKTVVSGWSVVGQARGTVLMVSGE